MVASAPALAGSLTLVITLAALWVSGVASVAPEGSLPVWRGSAASFVVAWLFGHAAIADLGLIGAPAFGVSGLLVAGIALSPVGRQLATLSPRWLVGIQAAHLPLELLRWRLNAEGSLALTSFEHLHLNAAYGLAAIVLAAVPSLPRWALVSLSILGGALGLANLVQTSLHPGILALSPWVWLPCFAGLGLLGMNIVALRRAP